MAGAPNWRRISAHDVVAAIIQYRGPRDPLTIQKLLYYAQGWHLAWYGEPLFREPVEAWKEGPTVRVVYDTYKDYGSQPIAKARGGNPSAIPDRERRALEAVLEAYGRFSGLELRAKTHDEEPWINAWGRRQYLLWGNKEISHESMKRYFFGGAEFPRQAPRPIEGQEQLDDETVEAMFRGDPEAVSKLLFGARPPD